MVTFYEYPKFLIYKNLNRTDKKLKDKKRCKLQLPKSAKYRLVKRNHTDYKRFVILAVISVFHLYIFSIEILNKYQINVNDISDDQVLLFFKDDRTLWLTAVYDFGRNFNFGENVWQMTLWPPGHILSSTLIYLLIQNLFAVILFDFLITVILITLIFYQIYFWFDAKDIHFLIYLTMLVFFLISPIYRSALIDTFFMTDLKSTLAGTLAVLKIIQLINLKSVPSKFDITKVAVLVSYAGYIRLTYYQLSNLFLFLTASLLLIRKLRNFYDGRKRSSVKLQLIFKITAVSFLIFLPWILVRGFLIYPDSLSRGLEFSTQGRFALQTQWYDEERLKIDPVYPLIGEGIACKVDKIKCSFFTKQNRDIKLGVTSLTMDQDFDVKSREAILTFLQHPIEWVQLKSPIYGPTFFQRSVYDLIDDKIYVTWDRVFILFCFVMNPLIWIYARARKISVMTGVGSLILISIAQILQFQLTQLLFRFYLPAISFTLIASMLLFVSFSRQKR